MGLPMMQGKPSKAWRGPESALQTGLRLQAEGEPGSGGGTEKERGESRGLSRDNKPRAMALGPLNLMASGTLFFANTEGIRFREM